MASRITRAVAHRAGATAALMVRQVQCRLPTTTVAVAAAAAAAGSGGGGVSAPFRSLITPTAALGSAGEEGKFTAEQVEQLEAVTKSLKEKVAKDAADMAGTWGTAHADKVWQFDYYRHKAAKYIPAAVVAATQDDKMRLPSVAAKQIVFYAAALRDLPPDAFTAYTGVLPLIIGDGHFLMAMLHSVGTPAGKAAFQRIAAAVRRGGDAASREAAGHIAAVPAVPVDEWPLPYEDASFADGFKTKVYPYEVAPSFARAKDMLSLQEYMMLATTTVLEAQWAAFYATGDARFVRRVLRVAQAWADFMYLPDHTEYWLSLEKKLPDDIMNCPKDDLAAATRSVRAQMSRVAIWSIIAHSRRHQVVVQTLAEDVGALSDYFVEPSVRDATRAAAAARDADDARQRIEVLPTVLAMCARLALDAPLESAPGTAPAGPAPAL